MSDGGSIRIEVGSIEEIAFDCDNESIQETFTPPKQIDSDGSFDVGFSDGGRKFRVQGVFRDNNNVDGTINDENNECDVSFDASRGGGGTATPTVVRTPTPGGPTQTGGTEEPTLTPTTTPGGPTGTAPTLTPTGGGPTHTGATPTGATPTGPTPTSTPSGSGCPVGVEVLGDAGNAKVLDTGWTGIAHDATVIQDGKLTFTVDCNATSKPCGTCDVTGPIANRKAGAGDIASQRCTNDTAIKCTSNDQCSGGTCAFYFGAPLPLSAGGVSTCVTNQVNGSVTGTANVETGAFQSSINLTSKVFNGLSQEQPCPVCGTGSGTPNDGQNDGNCSAGVHAGQPCDINGRSPIPSFGNTSLDCPPNPGAVLATLDIPLSGSSGTETRTLSDSSPNCTAFLGPGVTKKCFCPAGGSEPTAPNACADGVCTDEGGGEGSCENGPIDTNCTIESFRGCITNADCPASGDSCGAKLRPCYIDNGNVGGSVTVTGQADPPDAQGKANPVFATLFCVPSVSSSAVNRAGGLPGLGRLRLPLATQNF